MFEAATLWEIGRVGGILWCGVPFTGEEIIPNFTGLKLPSNVSETEQMAKSGTYFSFYD